MEPPSVLLESPGARRVEVEIVELWEFLHLDFHLLFTYALYIRGARLAYRLTEGSRTAATGRRAAAPGNPL